MEKRKENTNYICVNCRRQFETVIKHKKVPYDELKNEFLTMHVNDMGLRAIERVKYLMI